MGHLVQSRAGDSLVDVYDVKGSQAPIERIDVSEVKGVHELGQTIQSERFSTTIRISTSTDNQNVTARDFISDLPAGVSRLLGVTAMADVVGRTTQFSVLLRDPVAQREVPIFTWDAAVDIFKPVNSNTGAGTAIRQQLIPVHSYPRDLSLLVGSDQPQSVGDVVMSFVTSGFGAGTVQHTLMLHIAFAAIGGISSRGLPVPSW